MPGVQPRVRYAQSINPDTETGGKSSRCRESNTESGMLSQSTWMPRPAASPPDAEHPTQSQVAQSINLDVKTGGKSSRRRASNPESGKLSQSTWMSRPAASLPDAGHPTQSQVCSVNQLGCQDGRQVFQMPGIQPRVRYAPSINLDVKTGGKSSRRQASNPESGTLSQDQREVYLPVMLCNFIFS